MGGVIQELVGQGGQAAGGWAVVAAVVAVVVGWVYWRNTAEARRLKGRPPVPPGSLGMPLLGETLDFLSTSRANRNKDFFMARVAKYGQVFKTNLFLNPTVSVGPPDGNKFLFANENKLVVNMWPPSVAKLLGKYSLATQVGEDHKRARRTFTMFFGPEGLQSFVPRLDAMARTHIASCWEGKDQILGVPTVKKFTFAVAADLFVSVKEDDPIFLTWSVAIEEFLMGILQLPFDLPGTKYRKARLARETFHRTLDPIIAQRKRDLKDGKVPAGQDLLSVLISTPHENGSFITADEIKDNILLLLFAGHDTSSITMAVVLKFLYLNPECLKEVIKEQREIAEAKGGAALTWHDTRKMKYTWCVCQEALRLQPPVQVGYRSAIKDFEYGGYTIPKGWAVCWSAGRSNKVEEFFPNPGKFDPSRFEGPGPAPFSYTPFGGGPHSCLGYEFARTEMMVFLHYVVLNFEWEMVDPNESISVDPMPAFHKNLHLKIRKRDNTLPL